LSITKNLYSKPEIFHPQKMHYCPGCTHGLVHKILAQVIEELEIQHKTTIIAPVGCAVLLYNYISCDSVEAAHGRAPAIATGIKRVKPDNIVISYQGDGDLLSIGMAETIHTANRGENISVIFINNAIYGMTGGQMAPTTPVGLKTKTTPYGRDKSHDGYPIDACKLLNAL
jgi:2-oxoglutarate/2-oxoacid ferredoxin oxidoreductase subunit beta